MASGPPFAPSRPNKGDHHDRRTTAPPSALIAPTSTRVDLATRRRKAAAGSFVLARQPDTPHQLWLRDEEAAPRCRATSVPEHACMDGHKRALRGRGRAW